MDYDTNQEAPPIFMVGFGTLFQILMLQQKQFQGAIFFMPSTERH